MTVVERVPAVTPLREDDVVAAIASLVGNDCGRPVRIGIGDDAAAWQPSRSHRSVITTDMAVENVHFGDGLMGLDDAGWRTTIANASDIAAMGARPVLATVALGIPPRATVADVLHAYGGIASAARATKLAIVGGDLSRAPVWTIAITAVGEVRASNLKTRAGAGPGCVLCVTGVLGESRAGLEVARNDVQIDARLAARALAAFRRPVARLREGAFLGADRAVAAMMDCSDGLSTDVARLARASGCGARIDDVPFGAAAAAVAGRRGLEPSEYAAAGGEDFELLVAVRRREYARVARRFEERFRRPLLRLGELTSNSGVDYRGSPLPPSGWDHFSDDR